MKLLTPPEYSHKTELGLVSGIGQAILYLQPATMAGVGNLCPGHSPECLKNCLIYSGQMIAPHAIAARERKTRLLMQDPATFGEMLAWDIKAHLRWCDKRGLAPAFRFNGTSDFNWESFIFPSLGQTIHQYLYDLRPEAVINEYTKRYRVMKNWADGQYLPNVYMTFSMHERNQLQALSILQHGGNVAVVFRTKKGEALPPTWAGYPVVDGDRDDLRWLDGARAEESSITRTAGAGLVVGLRAKGILARTVSSFAVEPIMEDLRLAA